MVQAVPTNQKNLSQIDNTHQEIIDLLYAQALSSQSRLSQTGPDYEGKAANLITQAAESGSFSKSQAVSSMLISLRAAGDFDYQITWETLKTLKDFINDPEFELKIVGAVSPMLKQFESGPHDRRYAIELLSSSSEGQLALRTYLETAEIESFHVEDWAESLTDMLKEQSAPYLVALLKNENLGMMFAELQVRRRLLKYPELALPDLVENISNHRLVDYYFLAKCAKPFGGKVLALLIDKAERASNDEKLACIRELGGINSRPEACRYLMKQLDRALDDFTTKARELKEDKAHQKNTESKNESEPSKSSTETAGIKGALLKIIGFIKSDNVSPIAEPDSQTVQPEISESLAAYTQSKDLLSGILEALSMCSRPAIFGDLLDEVDTRQERSPEVLDILINEGSETFLKVLETALQFNLANEDFHKFSSPIGDIFENILSDEPSDAFAHRLHNLYFESAPEIMKLILNAFYNTVAWLEADVEKSQSQQSAQRLLFEEDTEHFSQAKLSLLKSFLPSMVFSDRGGTTVINDRLYAGLYLEGFEKELGKLAYQSLQPNDTDAQESAIRTLARCLPFSDLHLEKLREIFSTPSNYTLQTFHEAIRNLEGEFPSEHKDEFIRLLSSIQRNSEVQHLRRSAINGLRVLDPSLMHLAAARASGTA